MSECPNYEGADASPGFFAASKSLVDEGPEEELTCRMANAGKVQPTKPPTPTRPTPVPAKPTPVPAKPTKRTPKAIS